MTRRRKSVLFGLFFFLILLLILIGSFPNNRKFSFAVSNQNALIGFSNKWNWGNFDKPSASVRSVASFQFDSDDSEDILVGSYDSNAYVISGASGETILAFSTPRFSVESVIGGNFTGNNTMDLLIGATDHKAYLVSGTSRSLLWQTPEEYPSASVTAVAGADLDRDGKDEAIIASEDLRVYALRGNTGNLTWISSEQLAAIPISLNVADLNFDRVPDIIAGTDRGIYALNGIDGSILWHDNSNLSVTDLIFDIRALNLPVRIIYSTIEGYVRAVNGSNGDTLWERNVSSEAIWDLAFGSNEHGRGIRLLAGSEDGSLYTMDPFNGNLYWSHDLPESSIVGIGEVKRESQTWWRDDSNATLIATRSGQVSCIYKDRDGRTLNEWSPYQAPTDIERIQASYLDGDDIIDFYLFLEDSSIMTLSGATGNLIWESPRPKGPISTIAVSDNRIIAGSQDGGIYSVLPATGNGFLLFSRSGTSIAAVIFRNMDQDEDDQEIIAGTNDGLVVLLDTPSGTQIWNNSISGLVAVLGTIHADEDSTLDVVVGSRDGVLSVLDGKTGNIEWWANDPEKDIVSLGISDFDGDGDDEIVVGSDDSKLYCYDHKGNQIWVNSDLTNSINRLIVADFDSDGIEDIAAGSYNNVSLIKGTTGRQLWRNPDPPGYVRAIDQGDLNQDGVADVIVGTFESVYAIDGQTGATIWAQKAEHDAISLDSADINRDGVPDFVVGTSSGAIYLLNGISGRVVQQMEAYHSVQAIEIIEGNESVAEFIFTDGSGIRSFNVARIFPEESNITTTLSNHQDESSTITETEPPLISNSRPSFGWTVGIAMMSLSILICSRKRLKNTGE